MQGLYWSLSFGPVVSPSSGPLTPFGRRFPQGGGGSPFLTCNLPYASSQEKTHSSLHFAPIMICVLFYFKIFNFVFR